MKRWLTAFVLILLATILLSQTALATERVVTASGTCGTNLTWTLYSDGELVIEGTGAMKNYFYSNVPWYSNSPNIKTVTIKSGVTSIGDYAFWGCSSLTSVVIPEGVTSIGYRAFYYCSSLTSIEIPDSVTSIGEYAFYGCSSLTSVELLASVTIIGDDAFSGCSSLTSIEIPKSVTSIGESAFYYCSSLTSVEIPEGVTSIGSAAFEGCSSLTSIEIPASVTSIGTQAFSNCSKLTAINVAAGNANYSSLDGVLFDRNQTILIAYPAGKGTSYIIPAGVASIGDGAFWGCSSLTSVVIPEGVASIGDGAFWGCSSLTSVVIPEGVTSIGNSAFGWCQSLTSVEIPASVTDIGTQAFSDCSRLTAIHVAAGNANYCSLDGVLFDKNQKTLIKYPAGKGTSYTIPAGVASIGDVAFSGCSSLTSIEIPKSVTSIGNFAFVDCRGLTSVVIPDSVTSIGNFAFDYCSRLTSVVIPDSVTEIGYGAFDECLSMKSIVFEGNLPEIENGHAFLFVTATADYPACNPTWTTDRLQGYGGELTWVPLDHIYGETDYIWSEDLSTATLNATCSCGHEETTACAVTREEGELGKVIFTASAKLHGRTYSESRELVNTLHFGKVKVKQTEVAYGVVYDSAGRLLYMGAVEFDEGKANVVVPDSVAAKMHQAKLFVMDSATLAPSGAAILPREYDGDELDSETASLSVILHKLYEGYDDPLPMIGEMRLDERFFDFYAFIDFIEGTDAMASEPMMGAIPHSFVIMRFPEGTDIAAVADEIEKNADPEKWIQIRAEKVAVAYYDNLVLLCMSNEKLVDNAVANFYSMFY